MQQLVNIHTHNPSTEEITPVGGGIHPWDAGHWQGGEIPLPIGCEVVGEIGLDRHCEVAWEQQEALFEEQLRLARERDLVVVLHCVKAFEEVWKYLLKYPPKSVIFHGFIGSKEQALRIIERGWYLSFGERSLRSPRTLQALLETPLTRLFVESDESRTPLVEIYHQVARARGVPFGELAEATRANFKELFNR